MYWLERGGRCSDGREEEGVLVGERRKVCGWERGEKVCLVRRKAAYF